MAESTPGDVAAVAPSPRSAVADALQIPDVVASVLASCQDAMLERAPTWDDWVDERAARSWLGELALVCAAWRRPAQRLHRSTWIADRDGTLPEDQAADVEAIVWAHRGPDAPTLAAFQGALERCPRATIIYCHKPPPGLMLPARIQQLYTTGLASQLAEGGLVAPQLSGFSFLQINPDPWYGEWADEETVCRIIAAIGCGPSLRRLTLPFHAHFWDPSNHDVGLESPDASDDGWDDDFPWSVVKPSQQLARLAEVAPRLVHLAFVDEWDRAGALACLSRGH